MNELINDEAVYRTAPATPGLLKKKSLINLILCGGLDIWYTFLRPYVYISFQKHLKKVVKKWVKKVQENLGACHGGEGLITHRIGDLSRRIQECFFPYVVPYYPCLL